MNWVFDPADRKGKVDLGVTGNPPSVTNTLPNRTKIRTGDPPIDGIGDLPGNLCQTETGVQDSVQARPSINNRGDIDRFAIWTSDTVLVQEDLPMLVILFPERNLGNGEFWHVRDIFKAGDKFANCDITRVFICRVI